MERSYLEIEIPIEEIKKQISQTLEIGDKGQVGIKETLKELEDKLNLKLEKQKQDHQNQLKKIKLEEEKKIKDEAKKQAEQDIKKIKKEAEDKAKVAKLEVERKAQKDNASLKEQLLKQKLAHQKDIERLRTKAEDAARAASQSPVERKGEVQEDILEATNNAGIMTRPVWKLMSELPAYKNCQSMDLSCAKSLSKRLINIPSSSFLCGEKDE